MVPTITKLCCASYLYVFPNLITWGRPECVAKVFQIFLIHIRFSMMSLKFNFQPFFVFTQQFIPELNRLIMWIYVGKESVIRDVHVVDYIALDWFQFGWLAVWRWITVTRVRRKEII